MLVYQRVSETNSEPGDRKLPATLPAIRPPAGLRFEQPPEKTSNLMAPRVYFKVIDLGSSLLHHLVSRYFMTNRYIRYIYIYNYIYYILIYPDISDFCLASMRQLPEAWKRLGIIPSPMLHYLMTSLQCPQGSPNFADSHTWALKWCIIKYIYIYMYPLVNQDNYQKSPSFIGKSTNFLWAIFNSYDITRQGTMYLKFDGSGRGE